MRKTIDEEWLMSNGFILDNDTTNMAKEFGDFLECAEAYYTNGDNRITIQRGYTNRYGEEGYGVHIDNRDYDSVGYLEVKYVDELEAFIKLAYDE